jgi:hypothetical protein
MNGVIEAVLLVRKDRVLTCAINTRVTAAVAAPIRTHKSRLFIRHFGL